MPSPSRADPAARPPTPPATQLAVCSLRFSFLRFRSAGSPTPDVRSMGSGCGRRRYPVHVRSVLLYREGRYAMGRPAAALLREAHEKGYRFPVSFEGFTARIHWETPDGGGEGAARIELQGGPRVEAEGIDDWAAGQLRSVIGHRSARSYEDGDGMTPKRVTDADHALGQKVELEDDLDSSYLVGGGQIAGVTRTAHGTRFTIIVQGRTPVGDGTSVPTEFCVAFWDEDGTLQASEAY